MVVNRRCLILWYVFLIDFSQLTLLVDALLHEAEHFTPMRGFDCALKTGEFTMYFNRFFTHAIALSSSAAVNASSQMSSKHLSQTLSVVGETGKPASSALLPGYLSADTASSMSSIIAAPWESIRPAPALEKAMDAGGDDAAMQCEEWEKADLYASTCCYNVASLSGMGRCAHPR